MTCVAPLIINSIFFIFYLVLKNAPQYNKPGGNLCKITGFKRTVHYIIYNKCTLAERLSATN